MSETSPKTRIKIALAENPVAPPVRLSHESRDGRIRNTLFRDFALPRREVRPNREGMVRWAAEGTPAGHLVSPEDVADVVLLLSSELSRMIVGQTIIVDGGYSVIAWP